MIVEYWKRVYESYCYFYHLYNDESKLSWILSVLFSNFYLDTMGYY